MASRLAVLTQQSTDHFLAFVSPANSYTGNEGPIDAFWGSNGFMIHHLAPKWGALLLFPEERYYGKSLYDGL